MSTVIRTKINGKDFRIDSDGFMIKRQHNGIVWLISHNWAKSIKDTDDIRIKIEAVEDGRIVECGDTSLFEWIMEALDTVFPSETGAPIAMRWENGNGR